MASRRALLLLPALLLAASTAFGQSRHVPEAAARGYVRYVQGMVVSVDGNAERLAPGATIRNQKNLIVVPSALPARGAWADFLRDTDGQVIRVWLLTPEEQSRPKKAASAR